LNKLSRMQRMLLLPLVALFVASISLTVNPTGTQAVGQASGVYFGAYPAVHNGAAVFTSAPRTAPLGVQSERMQIEWAQLEYTEGYGQQPNLITTPKLEEYDRRLALYAQQGIKPILLIGEAPSWAASRGRGPLYADRYDDFANFMRKIVQRWSQPPYNVKHWELWPEPDFGATVPPNITDPNYGLRRAWGDNGADYANMLRQTYPVIKAADPSATVILGSMAFDFFRNDSSPGFNQGGVFVYRFLDDVLAAGGGNYLDWVSFNSYAGFATGWETGTDGPERDILAKAKHIRQRMALHGVDKPLLTLEAGLWSCCAPNNAGYNFYVTRTNEVGDYRPTERDQAAYMAQLYARGLAADLKGVFWYLIDDQQPPTLLTDPDGHRGWWRVDGTSKPVARTMRLLTSRLGGLTFGGVYQGATVESGEIEAYSFTAPDGRTVAMMWSPYGPTETARVKLAGTGMIVYDAHGEAVPTEPADGSNVRFTVGFAPVFVEQFGFLGNRSVLPMVPRNRFGI
jgi:hypothetical protein